MKTTLFPAIAAGASIAIAACSGGSGYGIHCANGTVLCGNLCVAPSDAVDCDVWPSTGAYDGGPIPPSPYDSGVYCYGDGSACGASCVDLSSDSTNCGSCGHACGAGMGCSASQCVPADKQILPYDVTDAAYSRARDRIVVVSSSGNEMHLVDPHTLADDTIALPTTPTCVAVSPDGTHAAVGHDAAVTAVDLTTKTVVGTYPITAQAGQIALSDRGFAYVFPKDEQLVSIHVVDMSSGVDSQTGVASIYAGAWGAVSSDSATLFAADGFPSSSLYRWDIAADPTKPVQGAMQFGDLYDSCDRMWTSKAAVRVFTGCGHTFHTSDLSYAGSLAGIDSLVSVDDWSSDGTVAALGSPPGHYGNNSGTTLQTYEGTYLTPKQTYPLPPLLTPGGGAASDGRFVFHDAAGTTVVVILHASDPVSKADVFGVATY